MKKAVAMMMGLALLAPAYLVAAMAVDKVLPTTNEGFGSLLLGCWQDGWHATYMDGTEGEVISAICFETDGRLTFTYEFNVQGKHVSSKGEATYRLRDDRLHISKTGGEEWAFPAAALDCDAVIDPRQRLELSDCRGAASDAVNNEFSFGWDTAANPPDLAGCWEMRDPEWAKARHAEDPYYSSSVAYCFDGSGSGQVVVRAVSFNGYRDQAGNWKNGGGHGWDEDKAYDIVGNLLRIDDGQSVEACEFKVEFEVLTLVDCVIENQPDHAVIDNKIFDRART